MLPDSVVQKLEALPAQPGVYLFKDRKAVVVYVGKAKSVRSRVRSYFQDARGDARPFIPVLQRTIGDLETIVTANEKEATILENNLIKEHRPRYNVKLRDDKDFITLRLVGSPKASRSNLAGAPRAAAVADPGAPLALAESVEDKGQDAAAPSEPADPGGASNAPSDAADLAPRAREWPRLEVVRRPTPDG